MIEINEANSNQAMLKTYEHLKRYKDEGWKTGKAFALMDGWKNVYHLKRGSEEMVLEFDLRKTLARLPEQRGDHMILTVMSCALATDAAEDTVRFIKRQETPLRGCAPLLLIPGGILAAAFFVHYILA